jgi:tetrahydromethanopterin S-methyltransferase subunit F
MSSNRIRSGITTKLAGMPIGIVMATILWKELNRIN